MILKNTLNDDRVLYCDEYVCSKEIDEQKYCIAYADEKKTRPVLVNMEYWKPKKNARTNDRTN